MGWPSRLLVELGEQAGPDGRHRAGDRGLLGCDEGRKRLGGEEAVGHDHRRADHERGIGQPPGHRVEHGYDGKHPVAGVEREPVTHADLHRVQVDRAVAVDHALGVAGRAARVAHRGRVVLGSLDPVERLRLIADEVLPGMHFELEAVEHRRVGRTVDHHVLDRGSLAEHLRQQRQDRAVGQHDEVLGVVDDVGQLVGKEPHVEGVQHGTHRRHGEIGLEVLLVVPHERGDPLVTGHAQGTEGVSQLGSAPAHVGVRRPAYAIAGRRDHFAGAVDRRPVANDRRDRQRDVLHGAAHRVPPWLAMVRFVVVTIGRTCPLREGAARGRRPTGSASVRRSGDRPITRRCESNHHRAGRLLRRLRRPV